MYGQDCKFEGIILKITVESQTQSSTDDESSQPGASLHHLPPAATHRDGIGIPYHFDSCSSRSAAGHQPNAQCY